MLLIHWIMIKLTVKWNKKNPQKHCKATAIFSKWLSASNNNNVNHYGQFSFVSRVDCEIKFYCMCFTDTAYLQVTNHCLYLNLQYCEVCKLQSSCVAKAYLWPVPFILQMLIFIFSVCTPNGFARLFTVIGQLVVKPQVGDILYCQLFLERVNIVSDWCLMTS